MELPIQLSFFKKLDAYQALLEQNEHATREPRRTKPWEKEKDFLKWAAQHHHHLNTPIPLSTFVKKLKESGKYTGEEKGFSEAMGNLIVKEYVKELVVQQNVVVTKEGLVLGRVIVDVEVKGGYHRWKYPLWLSVGWAAVIAAVIILFANAYSALPFLPPIEDLVADFIGILALRRQLIIAAFSLLAGFVGHIIINPIISQLRKDLFTDVTLQPVQPPSKILGIVERFMYVIAWFIGQAEFIGLWLGLKAIGEWSHHKVGEPHRQDSGRGQYTVFLIGAALSLVVAFIFIWLAEMLI